MKQIKVSIIIVAYKNDELLFSCILSIRNYVKTLPYEIIVVDNYPKGSLKKKIKNLGPIKYATSNKNVGFSAGNNIGAKIARGKYLFFLNPDTLFTNNVIDILSTFLDKNKNAAIVSPLLLDKHKKPYTLQGSKMLTPIRAICSLSIIHKMFPKNPIAKKFWMKEWDRKRQKEVEVVPGSAFMVRKNVFDQIGGFDENFFLFFEENDFCKRVLEKGWKIYMVSAAKVIHFWGNSTSKENTQKYFLQSRLYYFKKHFGIFQTILVEAMLKTNKYILLLLGTLIVGVFLRLYRLEELLPFIGDQGWFYLSARDMLATGTVPLVGIPSSRPWLHQGPFWTYLLAGGLWIFNFNPVAGACITALLGIASTILIYIIGYSFFSKRVGFISSALYATSPLIVMNDRMPYHTSPIPFITLLLILAVHKWIAGNKYAFPMVLILLSILYNFEISTAVLWPMILTLFLLGWIRREPWTRNILQKRLLFLSFLGAFIPMIPMIVYDLNHGFAQTGKFLLWIPYRIISLFGFQQQHALSIEKITSMTEFLSDINTKLLFPSSMYVAYVLFLSSMFFLVFHIINVIKKRTGRPLVVLFLFLFLPLFIIVINQTPADAYMPILFPSVIFMISVFFDKILSIQGISTLAALILLTIIVFNSDFLLRNNFSFTRGHTLQDRIQVAKKIITTANGKKYNLVGKGPGSEFATFTMNYEYLTWWFGSPSSKKRESLRFTIEEKQDRIIVKK